MFYYHSVETKSWISTKGKKYEKQRKIFCKWRFKQETSGRKISSIVVGSAAKKNKKKKISEIIWMDEWTFCVESEKID